jgi:alpha-galactosidase
MFDVVRRGISYAFATTLSLGLLVGNAHALDDGMALTPPMGWNSWNAFRGNINETQIRQIIDAMVTSGMKDAGYIYVNLDDNWFPNPARDASGNLIADPVRFKSGIKALSDYAHSKGLKLGIYGDRGSKTCMGIAQSGSYGNEERDAKTFASWGIDYVKFDNCNTVGQMQSDYTKMGKAMANSGRQMVFSICAWETQPWMPEVGHLWRSTTDILPSWGPTGWSIMGNFDKQLGNYIYTRPGAWSDPDMLEVGNGTLSLTEYKAHFGLWALMAAPLITGNDVRSMKPEIKEIYTHKEVLAIDQDSMGVQGRKISDNGDLEVFAKPLGRDFTTFAVGLLNRSTSTQNITVNWKDLRLDPSSVTVRDVWTKTDLGIKKDGYTVSVPSHGLALIKVVGKMDTTATYWAPDLHFVSLSNGYGVFKHNQSNGGKTLTMGGKTHAKGFGVHSPSRTVVPLHRKFSRFQVDVGIDAEVTSGGSAVFQIFGNKGVKLYESPVCKAGGAPVAVDISVAGQDSIYLVTTDGGDGTTNDHADWASPKLTLATASVGIEREQRTGPWEARIAGDDLVVSRGSTVETELRMSDMGGRIVLQRRIEGASARVPVGVLPRGVYTVQVGESHRMESRKIVK